MSFLDNKITINESNPNSQRINNKYKNFKSLINNVKIPKSVQNKKDYSKEKDKQRLYIQKKINKRNVTNNSSIKIINSKNFSFSPNIMKEGNISGKIEDINKNSFFNSTIKPYNFRLSLNSTNNFYIRKYNKNYTHKTLSSRFENESKNINKKFIRLNTINPINNCNILKQVSKTFTKKQLLLKLKDLLEEIENNTSKNEKDKKHKKLKDISYLFLERAVKPQIPNLKNRIKLNKYLINDFKENESYQDYIKRSLKYKKINENYENAQMLRKEANQFYGLNEIMPPE